MKVKETSKIECPHCEKIQEEDIYDFVDTGDQEGNFELKCEDCEKDFMVEFQFVAHVGTKACI